ncbi:MAG: RluA family pseudouridine synthase [Phaeodactylibacter sp.]|nr:RluA family pseudouridine synthase [Phaeodactylibacter sp.]MCB9049858.1 RluA family pseudouridine synthase [Lewinellaceae bacterium]
MAKLKPEILFEDEHLIVAHKPPGLLSIPDRFSPEKPNLMALLSQQYGKVWTVHRIDRETSGLICFARTEDAHRHLSLQFEQRTVEKTYLALLDGASLPDEGTIDRPLAASQNQPGKMVVAKKGKTAITHYKVVDRFRHFTLVEARIETGRTHQIRVHFESIGHPLAVDSLYGRREAFYLSEVKSKGYQLGRDQEERPLMSRLPLHAWKLALNHPHTNERLVFEAPLPKDFAAVLKQLKKWGK